MIKSEFKHKEIAASLFPGLLLVVEGFAPSVAKQARTAATHSVAAPDNALEY